MPTPETFAPVAITRRSGFDESVHYGVVVGLGANGDIEFAVGDAASPIYPRSSNKPMQAVAMVRAGLCCHQNCWRLCAQATTAHRGTSRVLERSWRQQASMSGRWPTRRIYRWIVMPPKRFYVRAVDRRRSR
jgi:L-asparaginase II